MLVNKLDYEVKDNDNEEDYLGKPKKLVIQKFSSDILSFKWDLIVIAVSSIGIDSISEYLKKFKKTTPILVLTKGLKFDKNKIITMTEQI